MESEEQLNGTPQKVWAREQLHNLSHRSLPGGSDGNESACKRGRPGFNPWVGKIPPGEGMATHLSILVWRIPMNRGARRATVHWVEGAWGLGRVTKSPT